MRYLSLFSGIEAATVAWHPLGWECVAVAEVEPFPCAVLAHHYPDVPNLGDVTRITREDIEALGHIDVVVFGSPCQDLSVAGHRKGLLDANGDATRSGLFFTAINICHWSGARFWLWENVPGAFSSSKGRDFASVVEWMAGLDECPVPPKGWGSEGVALGTNGLLEWATLDAQWFGVAQRRRRVFALLDTGNWRDRPPILLEPEGMRGDSAPSREARKEVAGTISKCSFDGGAGGRPEGAAGNHFLPIGIDEQGNATVDGFGPLLRGGQGGTRQAVAQWPAEVTPTLDAQYGTKQGQNNQHINAGGGCSFRMVAFGEYTQDGTASAMKMRDYKDATDLVVTK